VDFIEGTFIYREPKYVDPQTVMYESLATYAKVYYEVTPNDPPDGKGIFVGPGDGDEKIAPGWWKYYCVNHNYSPPVYRYLGQFRVVTGNNSHTVQP